jgi:hypothetical protein
MAIDMDKLNAFIGRFVGDLGAAVGAGMVVIGERLGLYKAPLGFILRCILTPRNSNRMRHHWQNEAAVPH